MATTRRTNSDHQQYNETDIVRRRDEAVRRALNTPPKPLKDWKGQKQKHPANPTASEKKP